MQPKRIGNPIGGQAHRLTPADIAEIRLQHEAGRRACVIARAYGVCAHTVGYHVRRGKTLKANPYAQTLAEACDARRLGDNAHAAVKLRLAADMLAALTNQEAA